MTTNNGGTVGLGSARARPIDTILSGPASGVIAAARHRGAGSLPGLLTFDMGGTSTDMSVIGAEGPEFTMQARVGDFPLVLPVVSVTAIGAGGGSIIWRDAQGVTKIGPHSAGADPGPVCYGIGGTQPTVTDCYLVTGIIAADGFLGGRMRLDRSAAMMALVDIAGETGERAALRMADAALRVATAIMAVETGKLLARRGLDPQHHALLAYGGAGATHACLLADAAGLPLVVIPPGPATFCALGAGIAELRRDYARTLGHVIQPGADIAPVAATIAEMEREAAHWIGDEGEDAAEYHTVLSADMRYAAQAFDVPVALPGRPALTADTLIALFHAEHERLYGFADATMPVRVSTLRLSAIGAARPWHPRTAPRTATASAARNSRAVFHDGAWLDAEVIATSALAEGTKLAGPALLEQESTTIWVLPDWIAQLGTGGEILLQRKKAAV
jgi:N-methylhydantoinase A